MQVQKLRQILHCTVFAVRGIWHCKKQYFGYGSLSIAVSAIAALLLVRIPGSILSGLLAGHTQEAGLFALVLCAVVFADNVLTDAVKRQKVVLEERVKGYFTEKLGAHLMKLPYQQLEDPKTLDAYSFSLTCIDERHVTKLLREAETFAVSLITLLGVTYILTQMDWLILLLLALVIFANVLSEGFRMRHIFDRHKNEAGAKRQLLYARNNLSRKEYAKEIRLFDLAGYVSGKVEFFAQKMCELWKGAAVKSIKAVGWTYVLQGVQLTAVYLYLAHAFVQGTIRISDFTVYIAAVSAFSLTSIRMVNAVVSSADACKYIQSLRDFLSIPLPEENGRALPSQQPVIRFEQVSFRYPNREENAVSHLDLTIKPGVKYAVVGENGAGKTTFIKLLLGLYTPSEGRITVDGVDLRELNAEQYRRLFSVVFQDFHILGFGLDENIAMCAQFDRRLVLDAAQKIGLQKVIRKLPEQEATCMSTTYSSTGTELSGGQKQKLAVARAVYRDAPYMVLDEPTAALSPQSELELYQSFREITGHKGVIYISHRLASCRLCDEIFVFSRGSLAEQGSHETLMAQCGLYRRMFDVQASLYQEDGRES